MALKKKRPLLKRSFSCSEFGAFFFIFVETVLAEGAVLDVRGAVVDQNVGAGGDKFAIEEAGVNRGFFATFADGFELFDVVSDLQEAGGAFEAAIVLAEIDAEAISNDRDVELNGN